MCPSVFRHGCSQERRHVHDLICFRVGAAAPQTTAARRGSHCLPVACWVTSATTGPSRRRRLRRRAVCCPVGQVTWQLDATRGQRRASPAYHPKFSGVGRHMQRCCECEQVDDQSRHCQSFLIDHTLVGSAPTSLPVLVERGKYRVIGHLDV